MTKPVRSSYMRVYAMLLIGVGLIVMGVALFVLLRNSPVAPNELSAVPVSVNYAAPKLFLEDLSGKPVSLDDYLGKVVLVNLWATWCPPCREEMPALQAFYEKYKSDGFVLVAINQEETRDVVTPFVEQYELTFPVWLDLDYQAEREFNTISLPSSFVINREGRVRLMWLGGISKQNLEKYVTILIKE